MAKYHPLFHKLKSIVGYSIAIVVIVVALGISGLRLLLTTANAYQNEVEQLASSLLEQPVKIGSMDAKLSGLIPTLIFHDVQLISDKTKKPLFSLSRIDVGLSFNKLILQQKLIPKQVILRGMNLHVTRTVEGHLKIKGVDLDALSSVGGSESNSTFEHWILQQSEIALEESSLTWKDEQNSGLTWYFSDVNFLLKNSVERHQLLLSSKIPNMLGNKVKVAFDLVGDIYTPSTWNVKAYIKSKGLHLKPLQTYFKNSDFELIEGVSDVNLWFDWKNGTVKKLSGDIKLYNFSYLVHKKERVNLKLVSGIFDSYIDESNIWNISVDKFNYDNNKDVLNESKFSLALNYNNKRMESFFLKANYLKLDTLSKVITDNHLFSRENEERLNNLNIHGEIRDFSIAWQNNQLYKLKGDFDRFGINSWQKIPMLDGLSGSVNYEKKKGSVSLLSKNSTIGFTSLFRKNFKLSELTADINFLNTKQGFLFDVHNLITKNNDVNSISTAKLWFPKNDVSPHLDLQTYISEGYVSKMSHFLPVSIMSKALVNWMDKAFHGGKINKGTIVFNGELNKFPFDEQEGVLSIALDASELAVNYQDGWPKVEKANVHAEFTGQGMKLHLLNAEAENVTMHNSYAEISSFSAAELQIDLAATGSSHNSMQYFINSPILDDAKKIVNSMRFFGNVEAKIKINIPLDDVISKKKPLSYSGLAKLRDTSIFMLDDKIDITDVSGEVFFSDDKFSSKHLVGNILGKDTKFSLSSAKNKNIKISMIGKIEPGEILKRFEIPGANKISGITPFKASMLFPNGNKKNKYPLFALNSNLVGVVSRLPSFFHKTKTTQQKLNFTTLFTGKNKIQVGLDFKKKSSSIVELDHSRDKVFLNRGAISVSNKKAILPRKNILYIDGVIDKIKPSDWITALELDKGKNEPTFFVNPVIVNLDKLKILLNQTEDENKNGSAVNPKYLPAFEGTIKRFYLDNMFIGQVDFEVVKKKYGLHLDELIVSTKFMKLFSHGAWRYSRGKHISNMNITLSSKDFGGMLTDLGFAAVIEKGVTKAQGKIYWNDAAPRFSYSKLNGNIQLKIKDGNIIQADAGAGRLLGLFSLSALPRKLLGDFAGTFKSGFNFDTAEGEVVLENGDAYTNGFKITSAVADISVNGRTGIADRDYEHIIKVVPEVGGGVAGVTALLVNLPAGIGVWLLDKLTGKQFNQVSTRIYEVSGSWDKPLIEEVKE